MKLGEAPLQPTKRKPKDIWPKEVWEGSTLVRVYRIARSNGRTAFNVVYYVGDKEEKRQRGTLEKAMTFARFQAELLASGRPELSEVTKSDLEELTEARRRAGDTPLLAALDEWVKARSLVGADVIKACEAWNRGETKLERKSVAEVVELFKPEHADKKKPEKFTKSYASVMTPFVAKYGARYIDELMHPDLDKFIKEARADWTKSTRRKRLVTLFKWAKVKKYLPQHSMTEADRTGNVKEPPPKRILLEPENLARVLALLQYGVDLFDLDRPKVEPRPDLAVAVVLSAFCGFRSCEGHAQVWEDIDLEEEEDMNVSAAKEGTVADRPIQITPLAAEWLKLTPKAERTGPIHPYKTEVHTILRNHLRRTLNMRPPANTFRKSWVSYRLKVKKEGMAIVSEEAGHSTATETKHYRNARAKTSAARSWFSLTPKLISAFIQTQPAYGKSDAELVAKYIRAQWDEKRSVPFYSAAETPEQREERRADAIKNLRGTVATFLSEDDGDIEEPADPAEAAHAGDEGGAE